MVPFTFHQLSSFLTSSSFINVDINCLIPLNHHSIMKILKLMLIDTPVFYFKSQLSAQRLHPLWLFTVDAMHYASNITNSLLLIFLIDLWYFTFIVWFLSVSIRELKQHHLQLYQATSVRILFYNRINLLLCMSYFEV